MRGVEDTFWWYRALHHHVLNLLANQPPIFTLLDVGCGTGGMLSSIQAKYPEADLSGVYLSQHALDITQRRGVKAKLTCANASSLPFGDAQFDVLLSLDVLTHKGFDDRAAAAEMKRVLRPGGTAVLNLAAFDFLRGSHDIAVDVDRRYTRERLRELIKAVGLKILYMSYWNMTLFFPVAGARWLSRRSPQTREPRSDLKPIAPILNLALTGIATAELAISRICALPFGTSIIALVQK